VIQFEVAENWIEMQGLDEGDEWPEDLDGDREIDNRCLYNKNSESLM
jgi:hypothetical protein